MEVMLYFLVYAVANLFVLSALTILHIPIAVAVGFIAEKTYIFMRKRK